MTNKFEQLIELFIAEDEQGAKDLFHEIVVEKSRDIYEGLTDEDQVEETAEVEEDAVEESEEAIEESDFDEAELGGDAADDMIDDIEADEEGLSMEDDDGDEEIEDRVVDLEDALDELKAEFEALMGADDAADDDRVGQFIQLWDGVANSAAGVVIIGATNKPEDIDPACMRPGRFDHKMLVALPSHETRTTFEERNGQAKVQRCSFCEGRRCVSSGFTNKRV